MSLVAAVSVAADRALAKRIETFRVKSGGSAVAEIRILHPVSVATSISGKETPASPGVGVVSNGTVTITFADASITIKSAETEIIHGAP